MDAAHASPTSHRAAQTRRPLSQRHFKPPHSRQPRGTYSVDDVEHADGVAPGVQGEDGGVADHLGEPLYENLARDVVHLQRDACVRCGLGVSEKHDGGSGGCSLTLDAATTCQPANLALGDALRGVVGCEQRRKPS